MKKKLIVLGMSAIMALTMVSPLTTQKVDAHNSDGTPKKPLGVTMGNMLIEAKHSGHATELVQQVRSKYSDCYNLYLCKNCLIRYKLYLT